MTDYSDASRAEARRIWNAGQRDAIGASDMSRSQLQHHGLPTDKLECFQRASNGSPAERAAAYVFLDQMQRIGWPGSHLLLPVEMRTSMPQDAGVEIHQETVLPSGQVIPSYAAVLAERDRLIARNRVLEERLAEVRELVR